MTSSIKKVLLFLTIAAFLVAGVRMVRDNYAVSVETNTYNNTYHAASADSEDTIVTVKSGHYIKIRKSASSSAAVTGYLYRGTSGTLLAVSKTGKWTQIQSGDIKGWVKSSVILTGDKADAKLEAVNPSTATVTAKTLYLRKSASANAGVISVLKKDHTFTVISKGSKWVKIRYTAKVTGYVSAKYVSIKNEAGTAVSANTITSYEKAIKLQSADLTGSGVKASASDIALLAALCRHEAGTNYQNCLAVANIVLNRVKSSQYPNTIKGVIYQRSQFSGVNNGVLNKYLKNPGSNCTKAAKTALSGTNNIGSRKSFRAVWSVNRRNYSNYVIIGDNIFF